MVSTKDIYCNHLQLLNKFTTSFPAIVQMARNTENPDQFKEHFKQYLLQYQLSTVTANHFLTLIQYDNTSVDELSTGGQLSIQTITHLWHLLNDHLCSHIHCDLFIDLYHLLEQLTDTVERTVSRTKIICSMDRWPSGLKPEIVSVREANRRRIILKLIPRIEHHHSQQSKYRFEEGLSEDEKYRLVEQWWQSSSFHLAMAIKSPQTLNRFLDNSLSHSTMQLLNQAKKKGMPFFITPYYLSLLSTNDQYDDLAIRSYILYSPELVETYGNIRAWEKEDLIEEGKPNAAGWLLPTGGNIHRRYPEVAIFIPDSMGRACGGLCASCQRMYDFQSKRFNFDLESLRPKESWGKKLDRLMLYFEQDTQLRDILITGGDAFMSRNSTLKNILDAVYAMALRKRKANHKRADGEKYAEIQRIRLGSRLPAYLPMRIDVDLIRILKEFKTKGSKIGITQFIVQTHFQSPLEITPEAREAICAIQSAGWIITNQHVYTVPASRRGHNARLRQELNKLGVLPYYTFSVKGFAENYPLFTPNSRSLQEQHEEKILGLLSPEQQAELYTSILQNKPLYQTLIENKLIFAATDRNVLNLPAIGKSMTFSTIGITDEGKRILKFEHDKGRTHSPLVENMPDIYIVENKSIAAYLRQLEQMGEDAHLYSTIWDYRDGMTEPRFELYQYPSTPFTITNRMNHIDPDA